MPVQLSRVSSACPYRSDQIPSGFGRKWVLGFVLLVERALERTLYDTTASILGDTSTGVNPHRAAHGDFPALSRKAREGLCRTVILVGLIRRAPWLQQ